MRQQFLFLFIFLLMVGCSDEDHGKDVHVRINHYQQPVIGEGSYLMLIVQEEGKIGSAEWTLRWADIQGFVYEKGFVYDVIVRDKKLDQPMADGPDTETTLVKVLSKKKIAPQTSFEINLAFAYTEDYLSYVRGNPAEFSILGTIPIDCGDLCEEFAHRLEAKETLTGVFRHNDVAVKLIELK